MGDVRFTAEIVEGRNGRTRIDFHATYTLPFGPLGRFADRLARARSRAERDMRREIDSFKQLAEREAR